MGAGCSAELSMSNALMDRILYEDKQLLIIKQWQ